MSNLAKKLLLDVKLSGLSWIGSILFSGKAELGKNAQSNWRLQGVVKSYEMMQENW